MAFSESDKSEMRHAAIETAASAKAANTTLLNRTTTIEAESNAGGEINACQAYAKRAPAATPEYRPGRNAAAW